MSQQINLFNPIFLKKKRIFAATAMAQALGVLLLGMAALAAFAQWNLMQLRKQSESQNVLFEQRKVQLAKANADLVPRQKNAVLEAQAQQDEAQLAALKKAIGVLAQGEFGNIHGYANYFRAMARQHVDGVWITGVNLVGAGGDLTIQGGALDAAQVPAFIARLSQEPAFKGTQFGALEIHEPDAAPAAAASAATSAPAVHYVLFSLHATVVPKGAP